MIKKALKPKLDLLVVDIDDTLIYHRTVAAANLIFLKTLARVMCRRIRINKLLTTYETFGWAIRIILFNLCRIRLASKDFRELMALSKLAIYLHTKFILRNLKNRLGIYESNKVCIRVWAERIVGLGIKFEDYHIPKKLIVKAIDRRLLREYHDLNVDNPHLKVLVISQGFLLDNIIDPMDEILQPDKLVSNVLYTKKDRIDSFSLKVVDGMDKYRVASDYIAETKPNNVGLMIDDYDDIRLLKLKNIRAVWYKPKIARWIPSSIGYRRQI